MESLAISAAIIALLAIITLYILRSNGIGANKTYDQLFKRIADLENDNAHLKETNHNLKNRLNDTYLEIALMKQKVAYLETWGGSSSGVKFERLENLIVDMYTLAELEALIDTEMNIKLQNIVGTTTGFKQVAYDLVKWSERKGRYEELRTVIAGD